MAEKGAHQKHCGEELRLEAAKLIVEGGYTCHRPSQQLGVSDLALCCWIRHFEPRGSRCPRVITLRALSQLAA